MGFMVGWTAKKGGLGVFRVGRRKKGGVNIYNKAKFNI